MPTDTIVMLIAVVTMFAVFSGALAWGDWQTRRLPRRTEK